MKARVALHVWARFPDLMPPEVKIESDKPDANYARVSEWVEVEFPELTEASKRAIKLEVLRRNREDTQRFHQADDDKRAEKLAETLRRIDAQIEELERAPSESPENAGGCERSPA